MKYSATYNYKKMTLDEFQQACHATNNYSDESMKNGVLFIGMAEEAGEACGQFKRVLRDECGHWTEDRRKKAALEIFDTMWYCVENIWSLGYTVDEVASMGLAKLARRAAENKIHGEGSDR